MINLHRRDLVFAGEVLERYRMAAGLRKSDVARALQLDPSIITLWALDKRAVPLDRLESLAAALEVSLETLLEGARIVRQAVPELHEETVFVEGAEPLWSRKPLLWPRRWRFDEARLPPLPAAPAQPQQLSEFGVWLGQSALEHAGMTRTPAEKRRWECYCLLCGRGVGHDGVLMETREVPHWRGPCAYCGGSMLVREAFDSQFARMLAQPFWRERDEEVIAA